MEPRPYFCLTVLAAISSNLAIVLAQCAGDPGPCIYQLPGPPWEDYNRCAWESFRCYLPPSCLSSSGNFTLDSEGIGCLCGNKGFITALGIHLYRYCHCEVLNRTASIFVQKCTEISKLSVYNESKIIAIGSGQAQGCIDPVSTCNADGTVTTSSTTILKTTNAAVTPTSTEDSSSGKKTGVSSNGALSKEGDIAIGVSVGVGVPIIIGVVVAALRLWRGGQFWNWMRRHSPELDADMAELTVRGTGEVHASPTGQTTGDSESNSDPTDGLNGNDYDRLGGNVFTDQESLYDLPSCRISELRSSIAH